MRFRTSPLAHDLQYKTHFRPSLFSMTEPVGDTNHAKPQQSP